MLETGLGAALAGGGLSGCFLWGAGELPSLGVQAMLLLVCEGETIFALMCYFDIHKWV